MWHETKFIGKFSKQQRNLAYLYEEKMQTNTRTQGSHRRQTPPRCCHLGSYFYSSKSCPVRPLAWYWYNCAQFIAKPEAVCALRFSC